jgi:hypothetical protein
VGGLVQDLGFRFLLDHRMIQVNFFKLKQCCFSKKNKNQRVATKFFTVSYRVTPSGHTEFFLSLFFLQLEPISAPNRLIGLSFKTIITRMPPSYQSLKKQKMLQRIKINFMFVMLVVGNVVVGNVFKSIFLIVNIYFYIFYISI